MFSMRAQKNKLTVLERETITSGSVEVYTVRFEFSPDWDGMTRTAVFQAGGETRSLALDSSGLCTIPWEVLQKPNVVLRAGVYGERGGTVILPTIWAGLGTILEGVPANGAGARPPTPDLWEQGLSGKGDSLAYDGLNLSLMSGDKLLSTVEIVGGSGGTGDHRELAHRDAEEQHPISSITGLSGRLEQTMTKGNTLTVQEILKIMEVN